ncbi:5'-nucleotidase, lipoprotein e(P4) family [Pseudomarimonas salicorniae]|uniref:Acid phosphatase n=1 Tax=Pseudomarimonas salicorniae TaxID=2933270 RepID=A0ABT0GIR1_9GAMM|nr:HAD family acid phosphatase [Lysobacter sp. CAU 1642]MCK7594428.1 acid phosphatase [Lysobacter sp. CAU 1642]
MRHLPVSLALAALMLAGCAAPVREPAPPPPAPVAAAHDNLNATLWMQTAAEYHAAVLGAFNLAIAQTDRALLDPGWDALPPVERAGAAVDGLKPAVIVDADETMIDNSPFQARGIRDGEPYSLARWEGWVNERRARALPGALAFANHAASRGVTVFFVTNRGHANERAATVDNLRALGFPIAADGSNVLLKGDPRAPEGEKATRRQWVGREHRVLLMLGDNLGDFLDGIATDVATRHGLVESYRSWWGQRWIMLPNPSYGSWESAVRRGCADAAAADCPRASLRHD